MSLASRHSQQRSAALVGEGEIDDAPVIGIGAAAGDEIEGGEAPDGAGDAVLAGVEKLGGATDRDGQGMPMVQTASEALCKKPRVASQSESMRLAWRSCSSKLPRTSRTSVNENRSLMTIGSPDSACRRADSLVGAGRGIGPANSQRYVLCGELTILFGIAPGAVRFFYVSVKMRG